MKNTSLGWRNILYELNEFGCKIEFIQSKTRNSVAIRKMVDIDKYIEAIKKLVVEHENKLYLNNCDMEVKMIRKSTKPIELSHTADISKWN